jgi:pyrroline-5-carboxylate reductase
MGSAMLGGWLARELPADRVWIVEPHPAERLTPLGVRINEELPPAPAVAVVAVKPQLLAEALPTLAPMAGAGTLILSVVAGVPMARFEALALAPGTAVVRAMPNTPAAIGRGISALIGNAAAGEAGLAQAEALMSAVGETVRLEDEGQMDAVTALSGSGPAYVFHLIETMAAAGEVEGLAPDLSLRLARATVAGAGALAEASGEAPGTLREAVTSPGGTTAAALRHLMDAETGLPPLMRRAMAAAAERSRELGR